MYDSVGSINTPREFFQPLIDAGVNVLEFNPSIPPSCARTGPSTSATIASCWWSMARPPSWAASTSAASIPAAPSAAARKSRSSTRTANRSWRDTQVRIDGPVALEFQKLFVETWHKQRGPDLGEHRYFRRWLRRQRNRARHRQLAR
jgi:cardiolipin synthase